MSLEREFVSRHTRDAAAIRGKNVLPQRTLGPRVLVFFGSKPNDFALAGEPIPRSTPFDQIHAEMLKIARPNVDKVSAWHGAIPMSHPGVGNPLLPNAMKTDKGIDHALNDIVGNEAKLMKVIVYGYSLGGTDALELSRRMNGLSKLRIHLMVTVDAAVPFSSDLVNRRLGSLVVKNLNFFQLHKHNITGSRGDSNKGNATNMDRTAVYNGRESEGHILIHRDTVQEAIAAIRTEFFTL
ncbi:MAG TPA: hypothetical protein VM120_07595 [Bryobacteraceae bacterium]|nr:hypothetical protein [Bryobacteraceae bacterium]